MKSINKKNIVNTIILLAINVIFMMVISFADVAPIGPDGSEVGLASINGPFHNVFGLNMFLYGFSEGLGLMMLLVATFFAITGLRQLISRKSLLKVDRTIITMGIMYALVIVAYILFDKVIVINMRPVIMPDETVLEASYPSSHTMLACSVMGASIVAIGEYIKDKGKQKALKMVAWIMMGLLVASRLFSGAHWLTDIVGGVLFSAFFISLYITMKGEKSVDSEGTLQE